MTRHYDEFVSMLDSASIPYEFIDVVDPTDLVANEDHVKSFLGEKEAMIEVKVLGGGYYGFYTTATFHRDTGKLMAMTSWE